MSQAADPTWRHAHPEIEWVTVGAVGTTADGPAEVAAWWSDWLEMWASYVYRVSEYRDLGDWVLAPTDVQATGRNGIEVEMRVFQILHARDGKIDRVLNCLTEAEALEAAGLSE